MEKNMEHLVPPPSAKTQETATSMEIPEDNGGQTAPVTTSATTIPERRPDESTEAYLARLRAFHDANLDIQNLAGETPRSLALLSENTDILDTIRRHDQTKRLKASEKLQQEKALPSGGYQSPRKPAKPSAQKLKPQPKWSPEID